MIGSSQTTLIQTRQKPFETLDEVLDHVATLRKLTAWTDVGLLCDEEPNAILLVLLADQEVVAVSRFCLDAADSARATRAYGQEGSTVILTTWQGQVIPAESLIDLAELTYIWRRARGQSLVLQPADIQAFFERIQSETKQKGRAHAIDNNTRSQVWFDAHGRCMFDACGLDLTIDPTTGIHGNFAYLAHNVAAAEAGTRGVVYLSGEIANDPENILLLCDTHHRLVDTVAKAHYPAERLSGMRRQFCDAAQDLLDGLKKPPIPAYCVSWPVHRQVISAPSALQIAQAMAPIGARLDGRLNLLSDNEDSLRDADPEASWPMMPSVIESAASRILMQSHSQQYRAALFAMGLMPPLIALGAMLGNKCEITPMLRHRENGLWYWPAREPQGKFFQVDGLEQLSGQNDRIALALAFTAKPDAIYETAKALGMPILTVRAIDGRLGNGALAHPIDGYRFRQNMQELFHRLSDQHQVQQIHVLPCASNAACVFFGQAFDNYHPELWLYDFDGPQKAMMPRLRVRNENGRCRVEYLNN